MADKTNLFSGADAFTRLNRTPVLRTSGGMKRGEYTVAPPLEPPRFGAPYFGGERIELGTTNAMDDMSSLKHELIHQYFNMYPDAFGRMRDALAKVPAGMLKGDAWSLGPNEVAAYSVGRSPNFDNTPELDQYVQQSLLSTAQGPEQQRHIRTILSVIPPVSMTDKLRQGAQGYYNTYVPSIQRSLQPSQQPQPGFLQQILGMFK